MPRKHGIVLTIAAGRTLSACADVYEPTPKVIPIHKAWIISDTASLSHTLVRHPASDITTCSEPPPDSSFDQSQTGNINFSLISIGGGGQNDAGGESDSTAEVELAGRTPAVLLSQELFYRACEFSQNYKLNKDEALTLYNRTLDVVEKNWAVEAAQTTVTIGDTITTTQGATVQDTSAQTESTTNTTSETTSETGSGSSTESSSQ
jgi:hypothetical protein